MSFSPSLSPSPNTNLKCLISFCVFNSLIASALKKEAQEEESPLFVKRSPGGSRGWGVGSGMIHEGENLLLHQSHSSRTAAADLPNYRRDPHLQGRKVVFSAPSSSPAALPPSVVCLSFPEHFFTLSVLQPCQIRA